MILPCAHHTTLFYTILIIISLSEANWLECPKNDTDYFGNHIQRMETCMYPRYHQECCEAGCCYTKPSVNIWVYIGCGIAVVGVLCLAAYACYTAITRRRHILRMINNSRYQGINVATAPPIPVEMRAQDNSQPSGVGFPLLPHQHDLNRSGVPQGNNGGHVPITPPPAYNPAVFSPSPKPS